MARLTVWHVAIVAIIATYLYIHYGAARLTVTQRNIVIAILVLAVLGVVAPFLAQQLLAR